MRKLLAALAVIAACLLAGSATAAAPTPDARAWLVENPVTGEVLLSHDARRRVPIASITKLMTVIVALQHLKLTDVVSVDPRAAAVGQESIYLRAGQEITVSDLVKGAMIQSANDAADALALATAPSYPAFAELMNAKAKELGLTDSHFVRPDGLDAPDEYSSARDVTHLALEAMKIPPSGRPSRRRRGRWPTGTRSTPGTTCSASSPASSASRPGTPRRPGGTRSRRCAATARSSTRRSSAALRGRSATPTSRRSSPTASRSTGR